MFHVRTYLLFLLCFSSLWIGGTSISTNDNSIHEGISSRINGGDVVESRANFPYQAFLRNSLGIPFCSAVLIDKRSLLTAANCVVNGTGHVISPSSIEAILGELSTIVTSNDTVVRQVQEIIVHEDFNRVHLSNDIAILRIEPVLFNILIRSVHLAIDTPPLETNCVVSGWGATSPGRPQSPRLRSLDVRISENCRVPYTNFVLPGMLCAYNNTGGVCQGDVGAPLVCDDRLVGVVSWANGCGNINFQGVYADVSFYFTWIQTKQENNAVPSLLNKYMLILSVLVSVFTNRKLQIF